MLVEFLMSKSMIVRFQQIVECTIRGALPLVVFLLFGFMVIQPVVCILPAFADFDQSHSTFTTELKKYVDGSLVHYAQWKVHPHELKGYLLQLARVSPKEYKKFTENEKKAFWINAYNAITIAIVLDHYPIRGHKPDYPATSLRQITNVWEDYRYKVSGKVLNLYNIEHDIIRRQFQDPRMHFAVVCAAKGCPTLRVSAYIAATIDRDLEDAAKQYFRNPSNIRFDIEKQEVVVSKLFRWFPLDFASAAGFGRPSFPPPSDDTIVLSYVLSLAPDEIKKKLSNKRVIVKYMPFDWSLNDADSVNVGNRSHKTD